MTKKITCIAIGMVFLILTLPLTIGLENNSSTQINRFEDDLLIKIKGGLTSGNLQQIVLEIKNQGETTYEFELIYIRIVGLNIFTGKIWLTRIFIHGTEEEPISINESGTSFSLNLEELDIPKGLGIVNFQVCFYEEINGVQDAHCFIDGFRINNLFMTKQVYHPLESFNNTTDSNDVIYQK